MSQPYTETFHGELLVRRAPGARHEAICDRLHRIVHASIANFASSRLLPPRSEVRLSSDTAICPDLSLVVAATGKLWLAAEIVSSDDHAPDTVVKKQVYEEQRVPRLWMIDPRYDNVEIYHASQFGLVLKDILAGQQILNDKLLPEFQIKISELFEAAAG
ncbi:MAG TPA: Uma2 family endonuclease [Candidatus Binatia bacterium]|jgi:Uma2 family endonuclease|nr:Uma2 family endonuclease [Candidatus Binatia bacterium]